METAVVPLARDRRQRRATKLEALHMTVATLERAVPVVLTLDAEEDDDSVLWEGFLDAKAMRVRHVMRRSIKLAQEAKRLEAMRTTLHHVLREHRVTARVLAGLLQQNPAVAFQTDFERWSAIARALYKPWTIEQCQDEIEVALKHVSAFQWSTDKHGTGQTLFGWRSHLRVDDLRGVFQFQCQKTFRGYDMEENADIAWKVYTDPATYKEVIVGPRVLGCMEVLQELEPHVLILRSDERFPTIDVDAHLVNVAFRVATERGFTQCVRSICCPELMNAIDGPKDTWPSNCIWVQWERLDGDADGNAFEMRIGASFSAKDMNYAKQWMMEALGSSDLDNTRRRGHAFQNDFERWSAIARALYQPWTVERCQEVMGTTMREVNAFQWSMDKLGNGESIFGWRSQRRVDDLRGVFQFQCHKTFRGYDVKQVADLAWQVYTDPETYKEVILGPRVVGAVEVLQELGPHILILRSNERFPAIVVDAHLVNVAFRVETERGFTQCVRSICCSEVMDAIKGPQDIWPSNCIWIQWDRVDDGGDENAFDMRIGASLSTKDTNYAKQWMKETLGTLLRSERLITGAQWITES